MTTRPGLSYREDCSALDRATILRSAKRQQNKNIPVSEGEQLRVRNVIRLGFTAVLGLTFCLGILGLYQLHSFKASMSTIVEVGNEKTALAIKMRDAIRMRALTIQRMLATNDFFQRDQELQKYYEYSGMYRNARELLFSMKMTREERELHQALQRLTRLAQPINREAAEMLLMDPLPGSFNDTLEKAIFAQQQLLGLLDQFVDLQKSYARDMLAAADKKFQSTILLMVAVVALLLIVGSIIAKRVTHLVTSKNSELAAKNQELEAAWFEAANATHAKSKFLANISHEIRTPLTSIIGFAETLGDSNQDPEDLMHAAESIKRSGDHLYEIINDVLDISKIEAGQIELEVMEVSPGAIVNEVAVIMEERIRKKGLKFRSNFYFPLPKVIIADPTRLRQILLNLLSNAIKFTQEGIVCINTYYIPAERTMKFEVSDTGIGMSSETAARVFEPFSQADKSTTRKFGGTGLGLSISKQLTEKMGGDLICESTLGVGSTFTATISIGNAAEPELVYEAGEIAQPASDIPTSASRRKTYKGKVLLAEDTEENQKLIALHLRKSGIDVEVVGDGKQAMDAALNQKYDLIFMDMQMPVMGGLDAIKMLRHAGYPHPIVALTANTSQSDREACLSAGANGFISKPINFEKFYEVLDNYLSDDRGNLAQLPPRPNNDPDSFIHDQEFQVILVSFLNRLPDMVDTIGQAAGTYDWETLKSVSHQLKGLGGSFGYKQLTDIASKIHACAIDHSKNDLMELVEDLNGEFRKIQINSSDSRKAI